MKQVEKDIFINAPVHEVYSRWDDFTNLPNIMHNVKQVTRLGQDKYHWVAEVGGKKVEWDAQVTRNVPDKEIAWKSVAGDENAGHVNFIPENGGTHLYLQIQYNPPAGIVGDLADTLTQRMSGDTEEDLKNFKKAVESKTQPSMR